MKGYFITEDQMEDLHRRLELAYTRAKSGRTNDQTLEGLFRAINYEARSWQNEVSK